MWTQSTNLRGPVYTFTAFVLYALLHSLLASHWAKRQASQKLGESSDRFYRIVYNLIGLITFIPVIAIPSALPGETLYRLAWPWLLITIIVQLAGAAIILVGMLQTGIWHFLGLRQLFGSPAEEGGFVVSGLYRFVRHPLYSGGLLLIWFSPIMTTSLLSFNLAATVYLIVGSIFEERRLVSVFGEQYSNYQRRVPRFIPWPGHHLKS